MRPAGFVRHLALVLVLAGTAPGAAAGSLPADVEQGRRSYLLHCANCHGTEGDGKGPSARGLRPPPRDFTKGVFKWGSVPAGELPTDEDLLRIVEGGLRGTAMLPWNDIPRAELLNIIGYIKTLSPRFRVGRAGTPVVTPPDPWGESKRPAAESRGRILYHGAAQCASCHPAYEDPESIRNELLATTGRAWTPRPDSGFAVLKESDFGSKLMPPDFEKEPLRSIRRGHELGDLFRVIAAGVGGTAMPTWKGSLPDADIWALAHYVDGLAKRERLRPEASHAR